MFKKILLMSLCLSSFTHAKWVELYEDDDFITYIDPSRIKATDPDAHYAETWIKQVVNTDLQQGGLSEGDHRILKYKIKCDEQKMGIAEYFQYSKKKLTDSYHPFYVDYSAIAPESSNERISDIVCHFLFNMNETVEK